MRCDLAPSFADFGEPRESRTHRENYNTPAAARPFRPSGSPPQHLCSLKWPSHIAAASVTLQKPLYCTLKSTLCDSTRDNPNGARSYSDFRKRDFSSTPGRAAPSKHRGPCRFSKRPIGVSFPAPRERARDSPSSLPFFRGGAFPSLHRVPTYLGSNEAAHNQDKSRRRQLPFPIYVFCSIVCVGLGSLCPTLMA